MVHTVWGNRLLGLGRAPSNQGGEISWLDVKELYDRMEAERQLARAHLRRSAKLLKKAVQLDNAYRAQLQAVTSRSATRTLGGRS